MGVILKIMEFSRVALKDRDIFRKSNYIDIIVRVEDVNWTWDKGVRIDPIINVYSCR